MLRRRWDLADRGFGSAAVAEAGDPPISKERPAAGGAPASVPADAVADRLVDVGLAELL